MQMSRPLRKYSMWPVILNFSLGINYKMMPTLLRIFSKFLFSSSHHLLHGLADLLARRKIKYYPILILPVLKESIFIECIESFKGF